MNTKLATFNLKQTADFSVDNNGSLTKQALCFVEGKHKDNQGREHEFTVERLNRIAGNTNSHFSSGSTIPVLKDHKKDVDNTVGGVEGEWIVRPIEKDDIKNPNNSNLIGKMGLFTNNVILKSKDTIEKVSSNILNTISPGLDFVADTIREISLTPMPAIKGMSLFNDPITWEELEQTENDYEQLKEQFDLHTDHFFKIIKNILSEQNLENKDAYILNAIDGYNVKLMQMLEVNPQQEEDGYGQQMPQQPMPNYQNQMMPQQNQMMQQYNKENNKNYVAAFSMEEYYNKTKNY